jgi:hypothetical protein
MRCYKETEKLKAATKHEKHSAMYDFQLWNNMELIVTHVMLAAFYHALSSLQMQYQNGLVAVIAEPLPHPPRSVAAEIA